MKLHNLSIRQAALEFNMNYRTLSHYCKKISEENYLCENIVFQQLVDYILYASDIYFDLSPKEVRTLVYNLAYCNSIQMPIILFTSIQ